MNSMDEYLKHLRMSFEEDDTEAFNELKEDLLEQLEVCLQEGQTEAEVVAGLASPEELAADYYADRSMDAALHARTYVVPKEEVQDVFIRSQKRRLRRFWQSFFKIVKPLVLAGLIGLGIFFLIYVEKELTENKHLAAIPVVAALLLVALTLVALQNWYVGRKRFLTFLSLGLTILGVGFLVYFSVTKQLLYTGREYYQKIELGSSENVTFTFRSDADVEITTVEVASNESLSFIVNGRFKESDIRKIEEANYENQVDLSLDQEDVFDTFTSTGRSQLIFFIPKGIILDDFTLELAQGDLRLVDIDTKNFDLDMISGDVFAKNIVADKGRIFSEKGDVVIEESAIDLDIESNEGKLVITGLLGNLSIDVDDGLSVLKMLHSDEVTVTNHSSRMVLEDSTVGTLNASGESGQLVVKRTTGELSIQNNDGKIVAEENSGELRLQNQTGATIVIQSMPINGTVTSQSGFIKWLQDPDQPMQVEATTRTGALRNEFSEVSQAPKEKAVIQSESGDIKVLAKVE